MAKKLDAVMIQPTYDCALDCTGCYVKESVKGTQMDYLLRREIIRYLLMNGRGAYDIGHITLALDNLPSDTKDPHRIAMIDAFLFFMWGTDSTDVRNGPTRHITANSPDVFRAYCIEANADILAAGKKLELISFSHIDPDKPNDMLLLGALKGLGVKVNYNFMPMGQSLDSLKRILPFIDMSYVVLHKTGLGNKNSDLFIKTYKAALREIASWPIAEQKKIVVDHCVNDAFKYKETGFGCGANISKVHLWPDGHISGCPYNKQGGTPVNSFAEFQRALDKSVDGSIYDFQQCTIPRDYIDGPTNPRQSRFKSLQIVD